MTEVNRFLNPPNQSSRDPGWRALLTLPSLQVGKHKTNPSTPRKLDVGHHLPKSRDCYRRGSIFEIKHLEIVIGLEFVLD